MIIETKKLSLQDKQQPAIMKKQTIFFSLISALLLAACTNKTAYSTMLAQADSLLTSQPDSALRILQSIPTEDLKTEANIAYHALLLTQARDKNYIAQTDDSLIRIAVQYYDAHKQAEMQARAYYCWGSIYRNKHDDSQAISKFNIALSHTKNLPKHADIRSILYSNLGYLYYIHDIKPEAIETYREAELLAESEKDTISLCYALSQQGMLLIEEGEQHYPKAKELLLKALSIGETFSDSTVLGPIYHSLGTLYKHIPNPQQALQYARLNYINLNDSLFAYRAFLLLGNAYFINQQYDSAKIFLQKILKAEKYYDTKADAYMLLAEIARLKGDIQTFAHMERNRATYQDSARANSQKHTILSTLITHEKNHNKKLITRYSYFRHSIFITIIVTSLFFFIFLRRKKKQYQVEKQEWKDRLLKEIAQSNHSKEGSVKQIADNERFQEEKDKLSYREPIDMEKNYKTSALYGKVSRIAKSLASVETKENLNEEEWSLFINLTDDGWSGIITYLNESYNLSIEEIQICCLYLAQVPVIHMGHFVKGQSRSTIQNRSKNILQKMHAPKGYLLKDALFSLAEQLKKSK